MADSSFDIVSKIDRQEADNALNQARKEVEQRYDFKGTDASIEWSGDAILIKANSEERAKAILDDWANYLGRFVKVMPNEYRRALTEMAAHKQQEAA